jgi:hypothetical protein
MTTLVCPWIVRSIAQFPIRKEHNIVFVAAQSLRRAVAYTPRLVTFFVTCDLTRLPAVLNYFFHKCCFKNWQITLLARTPPATRGTAYKPQLAKNRMLKVCIYL